MKAGIQVSSFKPVLTSTEQVQEAFHKIKAMGCDIVQIQWIAPSVKVEDIAEALRANDLTAISVQELFPEFISNPNYYYELCRVCNCEELCLSRIPEHCTDTAAIKEYAATLCEIDENLQKEGRHLSFHPTKNDYQLIEDISKLDILMQHLPDSVTLCLDLYHVEHAGHSIVEILRHYGNRITEVHFKDYQMLIDGSEILVPAGQGSIDWTDAIQECLHLNVQYAFVEQERWERDPFDCIQEAFAWLVTQIS